MDHVNFYKQGTISKGKPLAAKIPVPAEKDGGLTSVINKIHYQNADNPDFAGTLDYEVIRDWAK